MDEQHTYIHNVPSEPTINIKVEKNSRGFNYEITVIGVRSVDEALNILMYAEAKLKAEYGEKVS